MQKEQPRWQQPRPTHYLTLGHTNPNTHHLLLRHDLCIRSDRHRQVVHNGGKGRPARSARYHSLCIQLHFWDDRARKWVLAEAITAEILLQASCLDGW